MRTLAFTQAFRRPWCLWVSLIALAACATPPPAGDAEATAEFLEANDPAEPFNRVLYDINSEIYYFVISPLSYGYRYVVPKPIRNGIENVVITAESPIVAVNFVLQGNFCRAGDTMARFLLNATAGLGGLIDVASDAGLPADTTDFGVTLGSWGVPSGPYLYLPVLTSSSLRDLGGLGVDFAADPWSWAFHGEMIDEPDIARLGAQVVDSTDRHINLARKLDHSSLDPYALYRSIYRQYRQNLVNQANDPDRGVVCGTD